MAPKVLDAYALIAFLEGEPGADKVRELLVKAEEQKGTKLLMSVVNLGEIWYSIARTNSATKADECIEEIRGMAIEIIDADWQQTRIAAEFKARGNIAYGDCFAAALAKNSKAELVTGDTEFRQLDGEIKILWL